MSIGAARVRGLILAAAPVFAGGLSSTLAATTGGADWSSVSTVCSTPQSNDSEAQL